MENNPLKPPALDPKTLPVKTGSDYPEPFKAAVAGRERRALGDALGLKNFGVNFTRLPPAMLPRSATGTAARTSSSISSRVRWCWSPTPANRS